MVMLVWSAVGISFPCTSVFSVVSIWLPFRTTEYTENTETKKSPEKTKNETAKVLAFYYCIAGAPIAAHSSFDGPYTPGTGKPA